jgi:hypothetical protein
MVVSIQKVPLQGFGKLPAATRRLPGYPLSVPTESVLMFFCNVEVKVKEGLTTWKNVY